MIHFVILGSTTALMQLIGVHRHSVRTGMSISLTRDQFTGVPGGMQDLRPVGLDVTHIGFEMNMGPKLMAIPPKPRLILFTHIQ